MSVSFNTIPSGIRVPLFYAEMDNSAAATPTSQTASLLIGQMGEGKAEAGKPVYVSTAAMAKELFGRGSMIARMVEAYRSVDSFGQLVVIPVADSTGTAATGKITCTGTAAEAGTISLYVGSDRVQVSVTNKMTAEAAANANSADWYYWNPSEWMYDYEDLNWYDYYLVRGFAVVECGVLGTKGSDGFETCGTDLEIDAFKCVIEWLHGDRVAYTDKTSNVAISADWSSGKVGMTGRSYAGTGQFGLATTGVAGLETIVPVGGIASWYEYTNSQGISTNSLVNYSERLGWYCNGRYLDPDDYATIAEKYGNYMYQIQQDQLKSNGDYSEHWATRDYTLDAENIKCPALIVHGLNDDNVRTKEFDLMYQAYQKAGVNVKLLLHQDAHLTPSYPAGNLEIGRASCRERV